MRSEGRGDKEACSLLQPRVFDPGKERFVTF